MAASDDGGGGRQLSVIDDHADTIAFRTNKLKSHRQSNRRYQVNKETKAISVPEPVTPILVSTSGALQTHGGLNPNR
jgi:hypothetical protein